MDKKLWFQKMEADYIKRALDAQKRWDSIPDDATIRLKARKPVLIRSKSEN